MFELRRRCRPASASLGAAPPPAQSSFRTEERREHRETHYAARGLKLGMKSLFLHKLRSGLTVLGIVFGVAAVISMLAIAEGSSRDAQERIRALGATNIIIRSIKPTEETQAASAAGRSASSTTASKYDDYDRLLATVPTIKKSLPIREIRKVIRCLVRAPFDGRGRAEHRHGRLPDDFEHARCMEPRPVLHREPDNEKFPELAPCSAAETAIEDPLLSCTRIRGQPVDREARGRSTTRS